MMCLKGKLFNILFSSGFYLRISYTFSCLRRKRKVDVWVCYCLENSGYCYAYEVSVYFSSNEVNETVDLLLSCKVLWNFFPFFFLKMSLSIEWMIYLLFTFTYVITSNLQTLILKRREMIGRSQTWK